MDLHMKNFATQIFTEFDKYWSEFSLILAIAVIMDPRYKIQFVDWSYKKLYGDDSAEFKKVRDHLFSLYNEYAVKAAFPSPALCTNTTQEKTLAEGSFGGKTTLSLFFEEFETYESIKFGTGTQKSQLELYLEEPRMERIRELDVLQYWKDNQSRYPELAAMARDILSIHVSTMTSEYAFSAGGRRLDEYHSSLKPDVLEGIICCKDWLFRGNDSADMNLNEITEERMNFDISQEEASSSQCSNTLKPNES